MASCPLPLLLHLLADMTGHGLPFIVFFTFSKKDLFDVYENAVADLFDVYENAVTVFT